MGRLMQVVYQWACGTAFTDICQLTDVMEVRFPSSTTCVVDSECRGSILAGCIHDTVATFPAQCNC